MKTVLMLCYHYLPANNGGVNRSRTFTAHLRAIGWRPLVLTTNLHGQSNIPDVKHTLDPFLIYRQLFKKSVNQGEAVDRPKPNSFKKKLKSWLSNFILGSLLIPDNQILWGLFAWIPALRWIYKNKVDIIYSTSPPESAHLLGLMLKLITGKPWVMDLRDPWTFETISLYKRQRIWRLRLEQSMERLCFRHASGIIINTPEATARYQTLYPQFSAKMVTITNGFNREALELGRQPLLTSWFNSPQPHSFIISHIGQFSRNTASDFDPTPYALLEAIRSIADDTEVETPTVIFAGRLSPRTAAAIKHYRLEEIIQTPGQLPHQEALQLVMQSDLLIVYDPEQDGTTYVRGKLYEYLGSKRSILAVLPEGASRNLVKRSGFGIVVDPGQPDAIYQALKAILTGDEPQTSAEENFDVSQYDYERLAQRFVAYLNTLS